METIIEKLSWLSAVLVCIMAMLVILAASKRNEHTDKRKERYPKSRRAAQTVISVETGRYERTRRFLSETGADYMMKKEVDPMHYQLLRLGLGLLFLFASISAGYPVASPVLFAAGFFAVPLVLKLSNDSDNKKIMPDIRGIYDTLAIKTEAGVFFTDALPECYKIVANPRLKAALLELNAGIIVNHDIDHSILAFNRKFRNQYIDTFCIIIRQALESGQTLQVLNDMSGQIAVIQKAVNAAAKEKQEMQVMTVEILVYAMILAVIGFYVMSMMGSIANGLL